ncbi:hypothetical protein [Cellulomonas sp. C5510]|uniref:hypothetical protein n=1 Tax=Cellulomonas sp. C5510 TaxID=2871170 RepID=UPI001C949936|nr:hypothetical protein [Cellulomonas sp. C5510]QZN84449.1 hypothetical protein K5O09_11295 [Cellulomonas sp. C5510]
MRTRRRPVVALAVTVILAVGSLAGCVAEREDEPDAEGTTPGRTAPVSPGTAVPPTTPATSGDPTVGEPTPGQPCEPGSHPDCSDATGTEGDSWRIIAGYADCVEGFGEDEAYGLCTDLDGDDQAGYADAG